MLLRTRISLFISLAFIIVCLSFVVAALEREQLLTSQFSEKVVADQRALWDNTINHLVNRMDEHQAMASENPQLAVSVARDERATVQRLGARLSSNLKAQGIADRLDILNQEGALLYSSLPSVFQTPIISPSKVKAMIEGGQVVRGIGNDQQHNISVVVAIPLYLFSRVVGLAVYATDIEEAIREMELITRSAVILVNRRGRLISGEATALWDSLQDSIDIRNVNTFQTVKTDQEAYSFVLLDQTADLGNLVTRLLTFKNVTAYARQHDRIAYYTVGALGGFLVLTLLALNWYLSRSFSPLTGGVRVLNALSRGGPAGQSGGYRPAGRNWSDCVCRECFSDTSHCHYPVPQFPETSTYQTGALHTARNDPACGHAGRRGTDGSAWRIVRAGGVDQTRFKG